MKSIAVVDNSIYMTKRVEDITKDLGIKVFDVSGYKDLISLMDTEEIDLVITEAKLQKEDGFELVEKFKKKFEGVPAIIMTNQSKKKQFLRSIEVGADDFLIKPFEDSALYDKIRFHLGEKEDINIKSEDDKKLNFEQYIFREVIKAKKEGYQVSVMMSLFYDTLVSEADGEALRNYAEFSVVLDKEIRSKIIAEEFFVKYGSQSFLGVFIDIDSQKRESLSKGLLEVFRGLKKDKFRSYAFISEFVVYPEDTDTYKEIIPKLVEKMRLSLEGKLK